MQLQQNTVKHVYGPVKSWRSGTSLGIDPIGEISTCSFNCSYCQLGKIQNHVYEIKEYVPTTKIINDLRELEKEGRFKFSELDVITFAGSGEPTLAQNLGETIDAIRELCDLDISILTNATTLNDKAVRERVLKADMISLKLDAPNNDYLKSINQAVSDVSIASIVSGIKELKKEASPKTRLQVQIMFLEKFAKDDDYIKGLCDLLNEIEIYDIQINTPSRPKPVSKNGEYWLETRGNHYSGGEAPEIPDYIEFRELPVIDREIAFAIEVKMRELLHKEAKIVNIYQND